MMAGLGQFGARLYRGEVSFDFVGRRRLWYAISALILVISIVAVIVRGLSFSVDFKGGAIFTFPSSSTTLSQVQDAVESGGISGDDRAPRPRPSPLDRAAQAFALADFIT